MKINFFNRPDFTEGRCHVLFFLVQIPKRKEPQMKRINLWVLMRANVMNRGLEPRIRFLTAMKGGTEDDRTINEIIGGAQ